MTLELDMLDVPFGAGPGLHSISLRLGAGDRMVLVGASGAGKTSLLRAVAGIGRSTSGSVRIGGRDVTRLPPERRGAVYLPQTPLLFPHMTVGENVAFPLRIRGLGPAERKRSAQAALAAVRLDGFAMRAPDTLSGGQRHRTALARAVVARPEVLLLDEPLTALDPSLRAEVRAALLAVHREYGPALLLVTHDLDEAALIADRIGVLLDGRLAQVAAPADLLTFPASLAIARFIGGFVEIPGQLRGDLFQSVLGTFRIVRRPAEDGPATAVVRADAITVRRDGAAAAVRAVRTLASRVQVVVTAGDATMEIYAPPGDAPAVGDTIGLAVPSDLVTVFAAR